jgi:hypothetical protein
VTLDERYAALLRALQAFCQIKHKEEIAPFFEIKVCGASPRASFNLTGGKPAPLDTALVLLTMAVEDQARAVVREVSEKHEFCLREANTIQAELTRVTSLLREGGIALHAPPDDDLGEPDEDLPF